MVMREAAPTRKIIIPEAQLTGGQGPQQPVETVPLKLTQQQTPSMVDRQAAPEEMPVAAVNLDEAPAFTVPTENRPDTTAASLAGQATSLVGSSGPVGSMAPSSGLFGQAGNAYKVVYVVDVSASLILFTDDIVQEMSDSIRSLVPTQQFHIVLAKPLEVDEFGPRRLVPAISKYKKEAVDYVSGIKRIPVGGGADPIEAFRRAFAVKPELIYFLTDGMYDNIEKTLETTLDQLNKDRSVAITIIGFNPLQRSDAVLQRIAKTHGGHLRVIRDVRARR